MQLLEAVVTRLVGVNMAVLVSGLLLVLSKMAHMDVNQLINVLAAMTVKTKGKQLNKRHTNLYIPVFVELSTCSWCVQRAVHVQTLQSCGNVDC